MLDSEFYLDLYSNSSLEIYPNNTLSSFRVQLPEPIVTGDAKYEVALCQAIFPGRFESPSEDSIIRVITYPDDTEAKRGHNDAKRWIPNQDPNQVYDSFDVNRFIPQNTHLMKSESYPDPKYMKKDYPGIKLDYYSPYYWEYILPKNFIHKDKKTLHEELVEIFKGKKRKDTTYYNNFYPILKRGKDESITDPNWKYPFQVFEENEILYLGIRDPRIIIEMQGPILQRLGIALPSNSTIRFPDPGIYELAKTRNLFRSKLGPDILNVYTDIITPQITSNKRTPLLKTIAVTQEANIVSQEFVSRNYIPVNVESFQTIEIQIRDVTGELVPFSAGIVFLRLHFRRRRV